MKRILLEIAYDGTDYHGFARQKTDPETIEGHIDSALSRLTGEDIQVIGASRTDAGVHALKNVAVFDTGSGIPPENFAPALNTLLPRDIRVRASRETEPDFHPRHCDVVKTYRYEIDNERIPDPLKERYSMCVGYDLDIERMREAASRLVGEHDFKSFCSVHTEASTTVRRITSIDVTREGSSVYITVSGCGFLYNMVRIIAGTLVDAGRGRLAPSDVDDILYAVDRRANPSPTADAKGLTLMDMVFGDEALRMIKEE